VVAGWRRIAILFHSGVLGRAGKSEAVAMDVKWLLGRAGESVVAIGCYVKWAGLITTLTLTLYFENKYETSPNLYGREVVAT